MPDSPPAPFPSLPWERNSQGIQGSKAHIGGTLTPCQWLVVRTANVRRRSHSAQWLFGAALAP
jgi:hypothetical protein